ncbi:hypothetical protein ACDF64_07665 [Agromyces sp. MMS24-JH15]|uniref:hypothetical protein n=1 Tax=Agromyces sp. MMS24-JH15 TaxID=3243765 RepID=UPI003748DA4A
MDPTELIIPLLGLGGAVLSGTFALLSRRAEQRFAIERESSRELAISVARQRDVLQQSIEPLLYAASDLQSRIYNILEGEFLQTHAAHSNVRWSRNAVEYTCFLFAQYFGWAESIRQAALFRESAELVPARGANDRDDAALTIAGILREVGDALRTDAYGTGFMLFSGDQHAIGELMFSWDPVSGGRSPKVMRFATFSERFADPAFRQWFDPIVEELEPDGVSADAARRLAVVQRLLVDLMDTLDPYHAVYKRRRKVEEPMDAPAGRAPTPLADAQPGEEARV